jgi:hypothetical protein
VGIADGEEEVARGAAVLAVDGLADPADGEAER